MSKQHLHLPEPLGLQSQNITSSPIQLVFRDEHRKANVETKEGRFIAKIKSCSSWTPGRPWIEFRDEQDAAFYKLKARSKFLGSRYELRDMNEKVLANLESNGSKQLDVSFTSCVSSPPKPTVLQVLKRERWGHDYDIFCGPRNDVVAATARRDKRVFHTAEWTIDVAQGVDVMVIVAAILTFGAMTKGSSNAAGASAAAAGAAASAGGAGGGGC